MRGFIERLLRATQQELGNCMWLLKPWLRTTAIECEKIWKNIFGLLVWKKKIIF